MNSIQSIERVSGDSISVRPLVDYHSKRLFFKIKRLFDAFHFLVHHVYYSFALLFEKPSILVIVRLHVNN